MTTQEMMKRDQNHNLENVRGGRRVTPVCDVFENQDEILLLVDVPGVEQDGLDVRLDGGQLDLQARQTPVEGFNLEPVVFARSFNVPSTVDAEKVGAELEMGVLRVRLPKSEAAKPRRIQVKAS